MKTERNYYQEKKYEKLKNHIVSSLETRAYEFPLFVTYTYKNQEGKDIKSIEADFEKYIQSIKNQKIKYLAVIEKGGKDFSGRYHVHSIILNENKTSRITNNWKHGFTNCQIIKSPYKFNITEVAQYNFKFQYGKDSRKPYLTNIN